MQHMVVLANSKKPGGSCLAGKLLEADGHVGDWIRPVIGPAEAGLPLHRTVCDDGQPVMPLDVIATSWAAPVPARHQRENHLLGASGLLRCGRVGWDALPALADAPAMLWVNTSSSGCGLNDRVPESMLDQLQDSLKLVGVHDLVLYALPGYGGKMKHRADFRIGMHRYNLALTDTVAMRWLNSSPRIELPEAYVCVSLAVPFGDGYAYKVAASVISRERAEGKA